MMNKKIIAILMTAVTISSLSAKFCRDENDNRASCTGKVAEGTGNFLGNALTLGGVNRAKKREQAKQETAMREKEEEQDEENDDEDKE